MELEALPIRPDWRRLRGSDGEGGSPAVCRSEAVAAPKIRLLRSADISAGSTLQVLNLIAFPRPEYALPFFCADLVTFPRGHLIVLDVNPLYKTREYHTRFIAPFMSLCEEYAKAGRELSVIAVHIKPQFYEPVVTELLGLNLEKLTISQPNYSYQY